MPWDNFCCDWLIAVEQQSSENTKKNPLSEIIHILIKSGEHSDFELCVLWTDCLKASLHGTNVQWSLGEQKDAVMWKPCKSHFRGGRRGGPRFQQCVISECLSYQWARWWDDARFFIWTLISCWPDVHSVDHPLGLPYYSSVQLSNRNCEELHLGLSYCRCFTWTIRSFSAAHTNIQTEHFGVWEHNQVLRGTIWSPLDPLSHKSINEAEGTVLLKRLWLT